MPGSADVAAGLLRAQVAHAFAAARWQVDGLRDEEYFWEPYPECWSVRRRDAARSAQPCGPGDWVIDGEWPLSGPPPVTTIAFRIVHLVAWTAVYADWMFADATRSYADFEIPGHAQAAVALLHRVQDEFSAAVVPLRDESLQELRLAHWGEEYPVGMLVWQIAVEHLHHSAEIGLLRDLQRGVARSDVWPEPVTTIEA
jgi:DinB superfamily